MRILFLVKGDEAPTGSPAIITSGAFEFQVAPVDASSAAHRTVLVLLLLAQCLGTSKKLIRACLRWNRIRQMADNAPDDIGVTSIHLAVLYYLEWFSNNL